MMPKTQPVILATRGSALALAQTEMILQQCKALFPELAFEISIIKTTGDKLQTASLASANLPKGLFTKELEMALLEGRASIAVHSLKDLPTELPDGLVVGAVAERADVRDVLIYRDQQYPHPAGRGFPVFLGYHDMPQGASIGTSSTRRAAYVHELRSDIHTVPIRGNVPTRLRRFLEQPGLDALILATAGLHRLGYTITKEGRLVGKDIPEGLLAQPIPVEHMLPCVGQAAIGLEIRGDDPLGVQLCQKLNHQPTADCVAAERAFLRGLGGGCQIPVAGYAECRGDRLWLRGASFLQSVPRRGELDDLRTNAVALGERLATKLK